MKKKITIAIALLLIAFGTYRGTLAVFHEGTNISSPISAGRLGIEIIDSSSNDIKNKVRLSHVMPGTISDEAIRVRNSKDKDLYLRVTLTRYWTDENGKKVSDADATYIQPLLNDNSNWIIIDDGENSNNEVIYYYYKYAMRSNEETSNFIDQIKFDDNMQNQVYGTYKANVTYEAEAVQQMGAEDAILSEWGMNVTFDKDGTITKVED